jgi:hypothetical protein
MKSYLPLLGVGLWLLGSCSTSDPSPEGNPNPEGVPVDYTVITQRDNELLLFNYRADADEIAFLSEGPAFTKTEDPLVWNQDANGFSAVLPEGDCSGRAIWINASSGDLQEQAALSGLSPCEIEILALAHAPGKLYIAYSVSPAGEESAYFGLRKLDMYNGEYRDIVLDARPVDLDRVGDRIYVLVSDQGEASLNIIEIFEASTLEFIHDTEVGFEAELLMRLGSDRLLLGLPDAHKELNSSTLQVMDNVRYQEGTEPGFSAKQPLASPEGGELYYRYLMRENQEIGAIYHLARRTVVLYDFKNFLRPDQLEFEYNIGSATALGYDANNEILIIGYREASGQKGGILRVETEPSLRFIDQLSLPSPPVAILTQNEQ